METHIESAKDTIRTTGHGRLPGNVESLKFLPEDLEIQCEGSNKKLLHLMEQAVRRALLATRQSEH